jgi:hypothetical protein
LLPRAPGAPPVPPPPTVNEYGVPPLTDTLALLINPPAPPPPAQNPEPELVLPPLAPPATTPIDIEFVVGCVVILPLAVLV